MTMRNLLFATLAISVAAVSCTKKKSGDDDTPGVAPTVTTGTVSNVTDHEATFTGTVTNPGNPPSYNSGFCFSTHANPTTTDLTVSASSSTMQVSTGGLQPSTTYHVRAFASNDAGTGYGADVSFTTMASYTMTTEAVTEIESTTATFTSQLTIAPNSSPGSLYFVYGTSQNPSYPNNQYEPSGANTGTQTVQVTGLQAATTYYLRTAMVSGGSVLSYGPQVTFKTAGYTGTSGGRVVYDKGVVSNGWRYLEAAPADVSVASGYSGSYWGCSGSQLLFTNTGLGDGAANTTRIMSQCSASNCAARVASNYSVSGVSGWFLPSRDEMKLVFRNVNNLTGSSYWTSSEFDASNAYVVYSSTSSSTVSKGSDKYIRPLRRY